MCRDEGRENGRLALRGGRYGAFIACANYPECKYTRRFAQPGGQGDGGAEDGVMGTDPDSGAEVHRKTGRFGPYVEMEVGCRALSAPTRRPARKSKLRSAAMAHTSVTMANTGSCRAREMSLT